MISRNPYCFQFESDPYKIINYLRIGTNIPIWKEFEKYILFDLIHFNAKSIILYQEKKEKDILGHVLSYIVEETLYFGFFGVVENDNEFHEKLILKLINYAQDNKCKKIKGPINIPTVIYGWGFMEQQSRKSLFISKPVNPPEYIKSFKKFGFKVTATETTWEGYFEKYFNKYIKPIKINDDYEIEINNWETIHKLKQEHLEINARNLPESSILTPHTDILFDNYLEFIKNYGHPFMFLFAKDKETNKYVGCLTCLPNPFKRENQKKPDSFVLYSLVVDYEHRKKGLGWFLIKVMAEKAIEKDFHFISTPIEKSVIITQKMAEKTRLTLARKHVVLEYLI